MLRGHRIAVIVPAYNEAERIRRCLGSMPSYVDEIIVVDDGSTDATASLVLSVADLRISLLRHDANAGVGAAIVSGYRHAVVQGADVAVVMAGDGQMDPADLPSLLLPVLTGEADYVKGHRLAWPGARTVIPTSRWWGIRALEVLTRLATGLTDLHDFQCGFTALRTEVLERIDLDRVYPRYGFPNDFLVHLVGAEARVVERVVRPIYDGQRSDLVPHRVVLPISGILARGLLRRLGAMGLHPDRPSVMVASPAPAEDRPARQRETR